MSVYFSFFVFPFINELATDVDFVPGYLNRFSRMGAMNEAVHTLISGFFQWKKAAGPRGDDPLFHDFTALEPLQKAEKTFYEVALSADEAKEVLDEQLDGLEEFARFIIAYIHSIVLRDERILHSRKFVESINFKEISFDVERMEAAWQACCDCPEEFCWSFAPCALKQFKATHPQTADAEPAMEMAEV